MGKVKEACGRCSMSTVVDTVSDEDGGMRNPFDGERIEIPEEKMRAVAKPHVWAGRAKTRLDEFAERVVYGR
jgi:hypothetical protein